MAALDLIKIGIDTPRWLKKKNLYYANSSLAHSAGTCLCGDKRNDMYRDNSIYYVSTSNLYRYSDWYDSPMLLGAHGGTIADGAWAQVAPSFGIVGTLGAGCTTTKLVTATATTAGSAITALGVNQLVRTDMHNAYRIKVMDTVTGLCEQRTLIANTASATPTFYLDNPLSFTPTSGATFEVQSGLLYSLGIRSANAAQTRYFGIAQGVFGSAGSTGITTATATSGSILDEAYVPFDRTSGEGFIVGTATYDTGTYGNNLKCLQATATGTASITGQASGGDAAVIANEYRNHQIRIVEDTGTPTAVGQRAIIASHTGPGASPVYTIGANWAVKPSANAKFVIENPNLIYIQNTTQAGMLVYNYNQRTINNGTTTITANTWSSTYANATHSAAVAAGTMCIPSWAHEPVTQTDGTRLSRHSYLYFFRGNSAIIDRFDIAGAANGLWADNITYNNPISFTTGSCGDIDAVTFNGEYAYLLQGATTSMYQFNVACPSLVPWTSLPVSQGAGTAAGGQRVVSLAYVPLEPIEPSTEVFPDDKIGMVYAQGHLLNNLFRSDVIG